MKTFVAPLERRVVWGLTPETFTGSTALLRHLA